jgi:glycosyltransferase involved in cell wall biosynthesis
MKKVLHIIPIDNYTSDGIAIYVRDLRINLFINNHKSDILSIKSIGGDRCFWSLNPFKFVKILNEYELIHFHSVWIFEYIFILLLLIIIDKKYVITCHGNLLPYAMKYKKTKKIIYFKLFLKFFMNKSKLILTSSEFERDSVSALLPRAVVDIVPNGVENICYSYVTEHTHSDSFNILYVGRISPEKGVLEFIMALREFDSSNKIKFVIAGPSNNTSYYHSFKQEINNISKNLTIKYIGEVDGVRKSSELASCDLVVLPSFSENFGAIAAEAILHARIVLTTTRTPWVTYGEESAFVCVDPSVRGFHSGLFKIMNMDHEQRLALALKTKAALVKNNNWNAVCSAYINKVLC